MIRMKNLRNIHDTNLKEKRSLLTGLITFCFLTVIILLNISDTAYSQNKQGLEASQLEEIRRQLRLSGMTESEINSKINLLKDRGGLPQERNMQVMPDLERALITQDSLETDIISDIVVEPVDDTEKKFDEFLEVSTLRKVKEEETLTESKILREDDELRPFGYEIFNLAPRTFEPLEGGPVDPSYPLGPSDEVALTLWGDTEQFHRLRIDREGKILIPDIGQVVITGLTLDQAEEKIKSRLSGVYSGLNPGVGTPSTFFDLSLGKLRSIRVFVMGEVVRPGGYTMRATVTAFNALYFGGGPNSRGSLRDVRVIRNGKVVSTIDLYSYLLYGKSNEDVRLHDGDALFVPIRGRMVTIKGEINAPALYELKPWDGLQNLITLARGLKPTAYVERVQVDRIVLIYIL